jgi:hypothetical protein
MPAPLPPGEPDTSREAIRPQLRRLLLLQIGVACFGFLAGLACYYGALYFGLSRTVALFAGVIFGALVWVAARSLLRDVLRELYRGRQEGRQTGNEKSRGRPPH